MVEHGGPGKYRKAQPTQTDIEILKEWMEKYTFLSFYAKDNDFKVSVNKEMLINLIQTVRNK